jgi:hypothetical protein
LREVADRFRQGRIGVSDPVRFKDLQLQQRRAETATVKAGSG